MTDMKKWRIAVDVMGGDNAPEEIVKGAVLSAQAFSDVEIQLYGDEEAIKAALPTDIPQNLAIVHASEKIATDDEPVKAIRHKKDSSMVLGAKAVKKDAADAFISAGNSGALLASGLLIVGRMKGIERPAFMAALPSLTTPGKQWLLMDSGANAESKPQHLVQYARMGQAYVESVFNVNFGRVGLLNNGAEASKGNPLTKQTHQLLTEAEDIHFIGNVEARDVLSDMADVIVTDGFTGNTLLKSLEGTAKQLMNLIKETLKNGGPSVKLGGLMIKGELKNLLKDIDYDKAGGALLFGVKAPVIKCHGTADANNIHYAIKQAIDVLDAGIVPELADIFAQQAAEKKQRND